MPCVVTLVTPVVTSLMRGKPATFIDKDSGDYFEYHRGTDAKPILRRSPFGKRWFKMAFEANAQLAQTEGIFTADFRVFHMLLPTIERGNQVYVNVSALAKSIRTTAPVVSRSIRKLVQKDVLRRVGERVYELNPSFGWYGSDNGAHTMAVKNWAQSRTLQ